MNKNRTGICLTVLAAALYAINAPLSKLLLAHLPPTLTAGFLYLGAGLGMVVIASARRLCKVSRPEARLTKAELPFTLAMILLDIAAPVCLPFSADRAVKMVQTAQKLPFYKIKLNLG